MIPRIGTGTDVHAFGDEGTELWVAGLHWPGQRGLSGHSDGAGNLSVGYHIFFKKCTPQELHVYQDQLYFSRRKLHWHQTTVTFAY